MGSVALDTGWQRSLSSFFSIRQEYFHAASESRKVLLTNRNEGMSVLISVLTLDSLSPALDPSDLILTRGTLEAEDEEAESDTDDIDHRVTEESREEPAFQNFMQESMAQHWKRNK
ncbi:hypothetical protein U0070_000977 [Myodes glareolus]|uniref:Uncharacterized protein n=1 Tax=Myodes glareolus TaxID=447135 RepID=A0AAW0H326_MYOGA